MQEYIWCLCHTTFRHRQINVQNHSRSNVIWWLLFCPFLLLSSFVWESHQIIFYVLRTIVDVLRTFHCIYLPSVEGMMFCRTDQRFWPALLRIAPASALQLRQNTASGREWEIGYWILGIGDGVFGGFIFYNGIYNRYRLMSQKKWESRLKRLTQSGEFHPWAGWIAPRWAMRTRRRTLQ